MDIVSGAHFEISDFITMSGFYRVGARIKNCIKKNKKQIKVLTIFVKI